MCPAFARAALPLSRFHCDCFSRALYGKAIDKVSEENQARAVKIHGFVMKALKFAFVVVVFLGIATG